MSRLIILEPPSFFSKKPEIQKRQIDKVPSSKFVRFSENVKSPTHMNSKSYQVKQATQSPPDIAYLQEIIKQQAIEIDRLTSELRKKEEFCNECLEKVELHYKHEILKEMGVIQEMEGRIERMEKEHTMEMERILKENSNLSLSLSFLRKVLKDEEDKFKVESIRLNETISQQEEKLKVQCHELTQMRSYISQSESIEKEKERVDHKSDKQSEDDLQDIEEKWKLLESEKNLIEERLNITMEMMKIQEEEMERAVGDPAEARKCLLEKWRFKVFQLMVQMKFTDISFKEGEEKYIKQIQLADNTIQTLRCKLNISEKSNDNKSSEIQLLSKKLKISKSEEELIKNGIEKGSDNLKQLCSSFKSSFEKHFKKLGESVSIVSKLDNRLKFLAYLVELMKGEMKKKNKQILEMENFNLKSKLAEHDDTTNINKSFDGRRRDQIKKKKASSLVEEIKFLSSTILKDENR